MARAEAGEVAIASVLARDDRLSARITILERERAQAEMQASVASLLMTRSARISASATPSRVPMFTLVQDGVASGHVEVYEDDLLRLVAGQDVMLSLTDQAIPMGETPHVEEAVINLRAQLERPNTYAQDLSWIVQGMFLSAKLLEGACVARPVANPTASTEASTGRLRPAALVCTSLPADQGPSRAATPNSLQ